MAVDNIVSARQNIIARDFAPRRMVGAYCLSTNHLSEKISGEINMPAGGKRPGAGRPKGVPNKATQAQRKAIKESGLTPLEHMLQVMRDEDNDPAMRLDAANKAAPYVHSKLATVDHKSSDGSMSPQMPAVIQIVGVDADGEG
ncbi:hypothetical protein ACRARG_04600 [Pseudooceanicola sp. C21-150M6]|uniref:hypothetical protein n=1 Tax=Pseudooceanicola sp. C21-150M6 TaxID=3434355 RepID=UPI003D7F358E